MPVVGWRALAAGGADEDSLSGDNWVKIVVIIIVNITVFVCFFI